MIRALYTAASGMQAQQLNLDNIANNLANASTTGFHNRRLQFQDLIYQSVVVPGSAATQQTTLPAGLQVGLGVSPRRRLKLYKSKEILTPLEIRWTWRFRPRILSGHFAHGRFGIYALGRVPHGSERKRGNRTGRSPDAEYYDSIQRAFDHGWSRWDRECHASGSIASAASRCDSTGNVRESGRTEQRGSEFVSIHDRFGRCNYVGTPRGFGWGRQHTAGQSRGIQRQCGDGIREHDSGAAFLTRPIPA